MRNKATLVMTLVFWAAAAFAGEPDGAPAAAVSPAVRFILQLGVLVLSAKLGGRLLQRWRLPRVLGEVGAGVLLGPHLLGGLALPFFPGGLMGDAAGVFGTQGPVCGVLTLTLVVYFFLAGLDIDLQRLRRAGAGGVAAGICGFACSFAAAVGVLKIASGWVGASGWAWTSPQLLLVGTLVSVTSLGMLGRMLADRSRLESPAGRMALTAALTDNAIGVFLLSAFSGAASAVDAGHAPTFGLLARMSLRALLGFAAVAACGFPIARYVNGLALRDRNYASAFAVSAACLLIAGGAMGALGLSVVGGAYVMGAAFSKTDLRHEINERLDFVGLVLLPACFGALGMQVDLRALAAAPAAAFAALLVAGVLAAKFAGGALPAVLAGLNATGCLRLGAASLPRGELSLAMAAIVLGLADLPPGVLAAAVAVTVVTCAFGPLLARAAFAGGGSGMRKPGAVPEAVKIVFQFPSQQAATVMISRAVEIFEDDGFYAYRLNRHEMSYRVSRESQVIYLHGRGGEVTFECSERERSLINAVMLELSSGIEQSLRELQKPLDDLLLRRNMQRPSAAAVASGMLRNHFAAEALKPRLLATTKQGAISELVTLLYENGLVMDRERAVQAVFAREQSLSTGLENGVAIPHARTDAVSRLVCAVGIKKEGLDFDSADGKPVRIVALVLAPDNAATPQLQLIAQLCRLLDDQGRAALLACETSDEMFAVLAGGVAGAGSQGKRPSPLAASLQWQSIALDLAAADQGEALPMLFALCARSGAVGATEEARKDVLAASGLVPRRLGADVAVFVIETPNADRAVASLGVCARPMRCADGATCRVCAMVLHPASAASAAAAATEALARALDAKGVESLLAVKTSKDALNVLLRA